METTEIYDKIDKEIKTVGRVWEWANTAHALPDARPQDGYTALTRVVTSVESIRKLMEELRDLTAAKVPAPGSDPAVEFPVNQPQTILRLPSTAVFMGQEEFIARVGPWKFGEPRIDYITRCVANLTKCDLSVVDKEIIKNIALHTPLRITCGEILELNKMSHAAFFLAGGMIHHKHNGAAFSTHSIAAVGSKFFNFTRTESHMRFHYFMLIAKFPRIFLFRGISIAWLVEYYGDFRRDLEAIGHLDPERYEWLQKID
jgi:hypothetical protein